MSQDRSDEEISKNTSRPDFQEQLAEHETKWLIEEYKEANEEARYRDKLMHNSYYLIAIALVLLFGNIVSVTSGDFSKILTNLPDLIFLLGSTGGMLLVFLAVIMDTYNEKRNRAETRRRDLEEALNKRLAEEDSEIPLFAIQQHVILDDVADYFDEGESDTSQTEEWISKLANKKIREYSVFIFKFGVLLVVLAVIAFFYLIAPYILEIISWAPVACGHISYWG